MSFRSFPTFISAVHLGNYDFPVQGLSTRHCLIFSSLVEEVLGRTAKQQISFFLHCKDLKQDITFFLQVLSGAAVDRLFMHRRQAIRCGTLSKDALSKVCHIGRS